MVPAWILIFNHNIIWWKNPALDYTLSGVCKTPVKWKAQLKVGNSDKVCPHLTSSYVKELHFLEQCAKIILFYSQAGRICQGFHGLAFCVSINEPHKSCFVWDQTVWTKYESKLPNKLMKINK